jgi:hypothetical protein
MEITKGRFRLGFQIIAHVLGQQTISIVSFTFVNLTESNYYVEVERRRFRTLKAHIDSRNFGDRSTPLDNVDKHKLANSVLLP